MSIVGNCQIQSHLLSKILLLVALFCNHQYSHCQFHAQLSSSSSSTTFIQEHDDPNKTLMCHPDQSLALLQFKSSFVINASASQNMYRVPNYSSYPKTETWKEGTDCCSSWDGVTYHPVTGHVIGLNLSCSHLQLQLQRQGTMSSIFSLPSLKKLNLAYNDFQGSNIPSQVSHLASSLTHLNLSVSNFSGNIPSEISHLSKLVSLDLSALFYMKLRVESDGVLKSIAQNLTRLRVLNLDSVNMFSVLQPASSMMNLSSSLMSLSLSFCKLQGTFPDAFLLFPRRQELDLSFNHDLKGPLPKYSWSGNGNTTHNNSNLRVFDLNSVALSGELPSDFITNLKFLEDLDLANCNLSGSIPASLGNLTKITGLDLFYNHFSGTIPSSIGNLEKLSYLSMQTNLLRGPIPNSILNLTKLSYLSLSQNQLEGSLPSSPSHAHHALLPHLQLLHLYDNLLNGTIPSWLFALPSLGILYIDNNSFTGHLDRVFVSQSLEILSLRNNKLSGPIPRNLSKSVSLAYLRLDGNFLTGSIAQLPIWNNSIEVIDLHSNLLEGTLPALPHTITSFSVSNNSFTGEISSLICEARSLVILDLSFNKLFGLIPPCVANIGNLSVLNLRMNNLHHMFSKGSKLSWLNLNGNRLSGVMLPRSLINCQKLEVLDLNYNFISDVFPEWLAVLPQLQVLVLRSN